MLTSITLMVCLLMRASISTNADSCVGRCDAGLDPSQSCQCNTACQTYGDCCTDYQSVCLGTDYSCNSRCGEQYNSANPCHCNDLCQQYGNCCDDYDSYCSDTGSPYSCQSRCGESYDRTNPCHCNDRCQEFSNCCVDYDRYCIAAPDPTQAAGDSCSGRCNDGYDPSQPCQCNSLCSSYGNCCSDYDNYCGGSGGGGDLSTLAQALWDADVNRLEGSDLVFNRQAYLTNYQARNDLSSSPLFTYVNPARLDTGTWPTFRALLDNYNLFTGTTDTNTIAENQEIENFLDEVFNTDVMTLTYQYMVDNNHFSSLSDFRAYVKDIWFTLYTRSSSVLDSSGFEHTFVGEVKNGKVSGYHNWLAFYEDEVEEKVNYYGYTSENEPNQILMQFRLDSGGSSYYKELASIIYGASPEFELAIFTTCFKENPNALSTFTMNGYTQKVQTWDYTGGYIGSAYFSV